ncbi:ABC transporter ATP-binding protein [Segnochrobactrum spirostomi]|uniref:ABC transporter ATP-binding protein n=1 Tax=Segnochrobactrum spirostomi TaxID=2608987 RepID=A0A6A7Y0B2_9HYPH|nr:ABC transporter ATP-binding protein [Segnochrobactrum spirostomi]MQT12165.1 ABC transporter ATP-binding protein [Segnochrobactrum spirostomi]
MDVLSIENLTVAFQGDEGLVRAVEGASLSVPAGRTVALVGESGSGKTVISQAVMGLLPQKAKITSGRILLRDPAAGGRETDIAALASDSLAMRAIRGNRIAIVFQEPMTSLSPLHTIGDQIGEAARLHRGVGKADARNLTRDMLRLVHFPDPNRALDTYPFELSGGLRQRAMIAMALICRPALLVADEPTTALDVTIQAEILKLIKELQGELGMAVLMITHDFGVVANVAHDVVVIYHGRILESGPADVIFADPQHDYLKALLRAVPRFDMPAGERLVPIRPIAPMASGFLKAAAKPQGSSKGPVLSIEKVCKSYGPTSAKVRGPKAMDDINFCVERGECLGIVGESGSGKTTTALAIMRAIDIDSGCIRFDDGSGPIDVASLKGEQLFAYRRKVQLIFQDPFSSLNPRMTVNEILCEPMVIHKIGTEAERAERARELMRLVGLDPRFLRRYPHSFSGGQRQRIGIARALALRPDVIVCDEPVSALDVSVQAQILNLLKDLQAELGLTYVFVSHNLAVVDYMAERVVVMCRGRVVEVGPTHEIVADPIHPYTKALITAVPEASLDHRLDFSALSAARASDPAAWPEPFRLVPGTPPTLVEMKPGRFVCAPGAAETALQPIAEPA